MLTQSMIRYTKEYTMNLETKIPKPPGFPGRDFSIRKAMRIGTTQQQKNMYNDFRVSFFDAYMHRYSAPHAYMHGICIILK